MRVPGTDACVSRIGQHLPEFTSLHDLLLWQKMGEIIRTLPPLRKGIMNPLRGLFPHAVSIYRIPNHQG